MQSVGVHVDHLGTTYILETTHGRILEILPKNVLVELLLCDVHRWMLKNAPVTIGAFGRILNEILADRCQVLLVQIWFALQLMFSVSESAPLFFVSVGANLANQPKLTKLSAYFRLPLIGRLLCKFLNIPLRNLCFIII